MHVVLRRHVYRRALVAATAAGLALLLGACAPDSHTTRGAAQGATSGAIAGAVGGLISGLVFGGDPVERAARGAVYGGATGAAYGAMAGSERDRRDAAREEAELAALRQDIGDEAFDGLAALARCRHNVSIRQARSAQRSQNPNHALAGIWLEVLSYADKRDTSKARSLFPALVEADWNVQGIAQAEAEMRTALAELVNIRSHYGLPMVCGG